MCLAIAVRNTSVTSIVYKKKCLIDYFMPVYNLLWEVVVLNSFVLYSFVSSQAGKATWRKRTPPSRFRSRSLTTGGM